MNYFSRLITFIIIILTIFSCKNDTSKIIDFESLSPDNSFFISNKHDSLWNNGLLFSKEAFTGKNCIQLKAKQAVVFDNVKISKNQAIKVSIWRKGSNDAYLVFKTKNKDIESEVRKPILEKINGWDKISYIFRLPPFYTQEDIMILVYNNTDTTVLFDNYKLDIIENILPVSFEKNAIKINIDSIYSHKLLQYRRKALKNRTISSKSKKWIPATFINNKDTFKIKLRFKGDWLDHIQGNKWSMRIKIKGDNYWNGFKVFSIQDPETKYGFNEYILHELLRHCGVLSPRYGFVPVVINNSFAGIFSYEEHFKRQLVESQGRREGPILKLDEEAFWADNSYSAKNTNLKIILPVFETSKVTTFGTKRIMKNTKLKRNYLLAQNKLYTLKNTDSINGIIDIKKFATLYSIIDLTSANHALRWHNLRFYYNPVNSLIEPVAFDGHTASGYFDVTKGKMLFNCCNKKLYPDTYFLKKLFKNPDFVSSYFESSNKINDIKYISQFLHDKDKEIKYFEKILNIDYPEIEFNSQYLNNKILQNKKILATRNASDNFNKSYKHEEFTKIYPFDIAKSFVNIYPTSDSLKYIVENFNQTDIYITAYSQNKKNKKSISPLKVMAYKNNIVDTYILKTNMKIKYVYIASNKTQDSARVKVNLFVKPNIYKSNTNIFNNLHLYKTLFQLKNNRIIFKSGNHNIENPIIIPKGYSVEFIKNTNLNFIKGAYLLSHSALNITGTDKEPVVFTSADTSARGVIILNAESISKIQFLEINNFNTYSNNGWNLTGALTIYQSKTEITNLKISNNVCEDALNIVSSEFKVLKSSFSNIYSDAFDSDFSTGTIKNCNFFNVGNDAIDCSGSISTIENCNMKNIGDKGISAGEKSTLTAKNIIVDNANIAFASKDKSLLTVQRSEIVNSKFTFASYVKKNEFGASKLIARHIKYDNLKSHTILDKNCIISIDGKLQQGNTKIDIKKLYLRFLSKPQK